MSDVGRQAAGDHAADHAEGRAGQHAGDTIGEIGSRCQLAARMSAGAARRSAVIAQAAQRPGVALVADIGERVLAEHVPLHAELAAGLAGRLDEAHLQHDLLRLQHLDGVDHVRPELLGDRHRLVDGRCVGRGARQHDAAVDRRDLDAWRSGTRRRVSDCSSEVS